MTQTTTHPSQTPENRRNAFSAAVAAIGGQRAAATYLQCNERHVRHLLAGTRELNDRTLERIAAALIAHADRCRQLERSLSPAFAQNSTRAPYARQQGSN